MRKREAGQAFILVLILLAIGALLAVPALRLTHTELKSSQLIERKTRALYAANAAQEWVLWALTNPAYVDTLQLSEEGKEPKKNKEQLDVCGMTVDITIIMLAVEGKGGVTLATEDKIKPTKTVEPSWVPDKNFYTYTYTIKLDHLSDDTSEGLDAICDIPPGDISEYISDSSQLRVDGGPWLDIPDPDWSNATGLVKWPADYDPVTETGTFSSDPLDVDHYFHGIRDFEVRQVKELRFQMRGRLANNDTHCNWVVLKPWNTLSGPQAPIDVGDPDNPRECGGGGVLEVSKTVDPEIIPPGEPTVVTYTIYVTNMDGRPHDIQQVIDYLPLYPEFDYILGSVAPTSTLTTLEPLEVVPEEINGVWRERVRWTKDQFPGGIDRKIYPNETLTLTFQALATKDVSGSYYNEVIVILKEVGIHGSAFEEAGVSPGEYGTGYSWNTGAVMVPAFDSEANADGTIIDTNLSLVAGGVTFTSWKVR